MRFINRFFSRILIILLMFLIVVPVGTYAADIDPVLALTWVPSYGDKSAFQGVVFRQDNSSFDENKYRISLYLQIEENGTYWVKPTYATPYVELNPDGTFLINYATGGSDEKARIIHLMLIPADYTPSSDFDATRARAIDYVKIVRTEQGQVMVSPQRQAPDMDNKGKPSGLKVSRDKLALNVGFYLQGRPGDSLEIHQITRQLDVIAEYADIVRFYSAGGEEAPAYAYSRSLGLFVIGTAWLSGNKTADRKELDALIEQCNNGYVSVACVGSETLIRGDLTADQLISDMEYVRVRLNDKSIPVTTADSAGKLLENYDVRAECDLLMPNCYPYWEGLEISEAADSFFSTVKALRAASPGKEIIVSETGWPTAGATEGEARAGETEASSYFAAVREWSLRSDTVVLWFAAADEPWKTADEGTAGAHWGLFDRNLSLKNCFTHMDVFRQAGDRTGQENSGDNNVISIDSIELNKKTMELKEGETKKLFATILPDNATDKNVIWSSSEPSIATVENGVVKGVKEGTTSITVKVGNQTASCSVTVISNETKLQNPFHDIYESDSYYNAVLWAYYANPQITNGMDTTHFGPNLTVTRGQAVTFLWRSQGCPEPISSYNPFKDVPSSEYFYKPILWGVEKGITKGLDSTHFNPMDTLSTQHIVTFMYRTKNPGHDGWSGSAAAWAADSNGKPFGVDIAVNNTTPCPRCNVVQFLYKLSK